MKPQGQLFILLFTLLPSFCYGLPWKTPYECRFTLQALPSTSKKLPSFSEASRHVELWEFSKKGQVIDRQRKEAKQLVAKEFKITPKEEDALWNYAAFDSSRINFVLRDGITGADKDEISEIRLLIKALNKIPKSPGVSFRGFTVDAFGPIQLKHFVVGHIFSDPAFLSSDRNLMVAAKFAENLPDQSVILEIHGRSGHAIDAFTGNSAETEILFAPGTKFRIRSIDRIGNRTLVTLDESV